MSMSVILSPHNLRFAGSLDTDCRAGSWGPEI